MDTKSICSKAPTRIDLAGGTVDIWPLYLFLESPTTLNLAIDLFAEAELNFTDPTPASRKKSQVVLESVDQGLKTELSWEELEKKRDLPSGLDLHARLIRYFVTKTFDFQSMASRVPYMHLKTRARSPAGAGLGGSSSLSVAMTGALASWIAELDPKSNFKTILEGDQLIEIVRDVETTVIQV
ncbi:MAG: hypothetical protein HYX41_02725, partial [Bdellovibrio sp.]|nr:hypothetical protein [Bdellovibrio sp.]